MCRNVVVIESSCVYSHCEFHSGSVPPPLIMIITISFMFSCFTILSSFFLSGKKQLQATLPYLTIYNGAISWWWWCFVVDWEAQDALDAAAAARSWDSVWIFFLSFPFLQSLGTIVHVSRAGTVQTWKAFREGVWKRRFKRKRGKVLIRTEQIVN